MKIYMLSYYVRSFYFLSGLIGRSFAMLFASAGYHVTLYDIEKSQVANALENILLMLKVSDEG